MIRPAVDLTKTFKVSLLDFGKNVADLINDGQEAANNRMNLFDSANPKTWY